MEIPDPHPLVESLKSNCSKLEAEIFQLEEKLATDDDSENLSDDLSEELQKLDSAKRELAAKLREILSVKRKLGDLPSHSELIQYERRFSELYVQIQEKHQQTQKFYATYNALLEIKELMLKETSLLNSISSQFQDAITSTAGRMKLIDSMEKIAKGSQQKLEKVQLGLREEQKACDALKERYTTSIAEQRRCHSLLKAFQVIYIIMRVLKNARRMRDLGVEVLLRNTAVVKLRCLSINIHAINVDFIHVKSRMVFIGKLL
ncbi:hypothetical protein EZV62_013456 [Acer yangbiense]|uniref:CCDC93 coiled-coil domain-containing protein n=1 Tax=Acer yangbiense TaxID=1000413 RepID=A0A5C7HY86_9ROSI|nr:hypothetical protein EZV62_013456 [Acer yangbiense]